MQDFLSGLTVAFDPWNLLYCLLGVTLGNLVGVLPGIGAIAAISILLPVTFYMDPIAAIIMLAGVYYGAEYGGSIASILLNLPGTASNAITAIDGYPMAKRGDAGLALLTTQVSSFVGGCMGIAAMIALSPLIMQFSLSFGPAEYFATLVLGLVAAAVALQGQMLRGLAMVFLGMLLGTIGLDLNSGAARYTFGMAGLLDGLSIVAVAMALFGLPEVIANLGNREKGGEAVSVTARAMMQNVRKLGACIPSMLRGSAVGGFLGPLPGAGPTIASLMAYSVERSFNRKNAMFGKGAERGVAAPESGNNAAAQTAFIPTMTLGIPGTPTMAIILGALMIHGISPGPRLVSDHPQLFWGLIASFWVGNLLLLLLNIPLIGLWAKLVSVPRRFLFPVIIALVCTGVYGLSNSVFSIWMVIAIGLLGHVLRVMGFSPAPMLIGFVLGPMVEQYFRRAMLISGGDFTYLLATPTSLILHGITAAILAWMMLRPIVGWLRGDVSRTDDAKDGAGG